jgi:uncharacterized protein YhbP (UPF0306 family)
MDIEKLIADYLTSNYTMQLATSVNGQPWNCTVYYVVDDQLNIYWASLPTRRHSLEIGLNNKVAGAVVVNNKVAEAVVGLQIEGSAEVMNEENLILPIAHLYSSRFNRTKKWVEDFSAGKTDHKLYRLKPSLFVMFDEKNFSDQPRKEWTPNL